MSRYPESWMECEIGEISPVVGGGTPPSKDPRSFTTEGGTPWITPADLSGYRKTYISRGARNLSEHGLANSSAKLLPRNALLFSSRAPVGYVAIAANPVCTNQGFKSFVLPDGFDPRYGFYYLRHIKPVAEERATGTTFKELSGGAAAQLPFLVAPLPEQKRIADKLEAVLGRVDDCRTRLVRVPDLLKRFRKSVLAAATSGRLTEDWRSERPETSLWLDTTIGEVASEIRYGTSKKCHYTPVKSPVLRIPNILDGSIDTADLKYAEFDESEKRALSLVSGDLLIIRSNGSIELVGRTALVSEREAGFLYAGYLIRIRLDREKANPAFIAISLRSPATRNVIELTARSTSGVNNLNTDEIRALRVSLPPLAEQEEIVRRVDTLFAFANRIELRLDRAQGIVDRLTPSTLAKAFRGELVPQDPNDEPASALLERIRAERTTRSNPNPRKKHQPSTAPRAPNEKSTMTKSRFDDDVKGKPYLTGFLREANATLDAEELFKRSELPLVDFYKQLGWEVRQGFIRNSHEKLEAVT